MFQTGTGKDEESSHQQSSSSTVTAESKASSAPATAMPSWLLSTIAGTLSSTPPYTSAPLTVHSSHLIVETITNFSFPLV